MFKLPKKAFHKNLKGFLHTFIGLILFLVGVSAGLIIVLMISENILTESITLSIRKQLQLDEPGNGMMFILDINKTYGLY